MLAVQITAYDRPFRVGQCPAPVPAQGEVLIEVKASGLCSTDLHLRDRRQDLGVLPRILGHESAGRIVALGEGVMDWKTGQHVLVVIDVTCHACRHCLCGETQRCRRLVRIGFERDGGHAELVAVPARNLIARPAGLSDVDACILPDATGCMYHALVSQGGVGPNQKVLILGVGGLGVHGVQIARLAGAEVIATSRREHRRREAARFGAIAVDPEAEDLTGVVRELTAGDGVDLVADCVGTRASVSLGLGLLRPGGKLLVVACQDLEFSIPSLPLLVTEKQVIGCRGCNRKELIEVVDLVGRGRLTSVVTATWPLSEFQQAVTALEEGAVAGRIVITRQ